MSENKLKDVVTRLSNHAAILFAHECVTQGVEIERSDVIDPDEEPVSYACRKVVEAWNWDKVTEEGLVSHFVSPLVRELVTELKSKSNKYVITDVTQDETPLGAHAGTRNVTVTISFDPSIPCWIVVVSVNTKSK